MRGIISLAIAIFAIGTVMLAGPAVEEVADIANDNDAVQASGNDVTNNEIVTSTLKWTPLIGILVALMSSLVWYLRRQRRTQRRRI